MICNNCQEEINDLAVAGLHTEMNGLDFCSDVCAEEYLDDAEFLDEQKITNLARALRLAVIQGQYNADNLTEEQAIDLLRGPLVPGDESTVYDDSDQLNV